jgi:hypothetical protein
MLFRVSYFNPVEIARTASLVIDVNKKLHSQKKFTTQNAEKRISNIGKYFNMYILHRKTCHNIEKTRGSNRRYSEKFSHNRHVFGSSKVDFDLGLQGNVPEFFHFKTQNLIFPYFDQVLKQMMWCRTQFAKNYTKFNNIFC